MKATLSPSWELSTEHRGEAFGPGDKVTLSPSQGYAKAAHAVARLAETAKLNVDGDASVTRCVASLAPKE